MAGSSAIVALTLLLAAGPAPRFDKDRAAEKAAIASASHPYAGIWKEDCASGFGLAIAPAGESLYSVSFCGPGGCFAPGTYRPNTRLAGDPAYRLIDRDTIEVRSAEGFQRYKRCAAKPAAAEDRSSQRLSNGFGAALRLTKEPEEFVREWTSTAPSHKLTIHTANAVRTGEPIAALVFFRGCRAGSASCMVYVDYELVAPDGSIRHRVPDRSGTSQPSPRADLIYLSHAIVRFDFAKDDPPGEYVVHATVREPATGNIVRVSAPFRFTR